MKKLLTAALTLFVLAALVLSFPAVIRADVENPGESTAPVTQTPAGEETTDADNEQNPLDDPALEAAKKSGIYNINEFGRFKDRTFTGVMEKYLASQNEGSSYWKTYYEKDPSYINPYYEGVLSTDTLKIMHDTVDFYRWMSGVAPLEYESKGSPELQKGALVRNYSYSQSVDPSKKPVDMDQKLWDEGAKVTPSLIGMSGKPLDVVSLWLNEGYRYGTTPETTGFTDDILIHRYSLLGRAVKEIDFGYALIVAVGDVKTENDPEDPDANYMGSELFTAFPSPGPVPSWLISRTSCAWSLEFNADMFGIPNDEPVEVKVTDLSTKESYTCTKANGKLMVNGKIISFAQPQEKSTYYQHSYKVEISGIYEASYDEEKYEYIFEKPVTVTYTVEFHDSALEVEPREMVLGKGESAKITANDAAHPDSALKITSGDANIASVDAAGNVKGVNFGETFISVNTASGSSAQINVKVAFKDVTDSTRSTYKAIYWGANAGVISGFSDYTFGPDKNCTRGQFAIMLWRMAGKPSAGEDGRTFSDVTSSMPYYKAISWAASEGIVNGFNDGTFRPEDPLTRAQIVIMIWRYLGKVEVDTTDSFIDVPYGNTTAKAVEWASGNGIVRGFSDGTFRPDNNCTREQIVTILYRAVREGYMEVY